MKTENRHIKRKLIITIAAILCVAVFAVSFSDGRYIPSWQDIFKFCRLTPDINESEDYVKIMDVGQGDSILIYSNGYSAVIDAGQPDSSNDVCSDLSAAGVKDINAMLITHLHTDHTGGLQAITERYAIRNLIVPDMIWGEGLSAVKAAKKSVAESKGGVYTAQPGMNLNIGDFEITVLAYYPGFSGENDKSVITMAEIDGVKFLFTGDAERPAENALLSEGLNLDCDVLKVGHHGSETSSQKKFLEAASPEYAAISVGKDNMYSHPDRSVLEALDDCGATTFRTDRDGDITFYVDNGRLSVETENGSD